MVRFLAYAFLVLAVSLAASTGCSTISMTEKQLAKVDSYDVPDIPALGQIPPVRPQETGLAYSKDVLIISYDIEVGKEPLKKAIRKYGAKIIYDYRIINAIAVRIPENKDLDEASVHFEKVKGVLQVNKDRIHHLDPVPSLQLM